MFFAASAAEEKQFHKSMQQWRALYCPTLSWATQSSCRRCASILQHKLALVKYDDASGMKLRVGSRFFDLDGGEMEGRGRGGVVKEDDTFWTVCQDHTP